MSCTGQKEQSVPDGGVCPHTPGSATYVVCWKQHEWCCNTSGCVISECGRVCVGTVSERSLTQRGQSHRWRTLTESRERERERERERRREQPQRRERKRELWHREYRHGEGEMQVQKERESERGEGSNLSPGYVYDSGYFTEVESITAAKSRQCKSTIRVYKSAFLRLLTSYCFTNTHFKVVVVRQNVCGVPVWT
jgi:hypothetical protein